MLSSADTQTRAMMSSRAQFHKIGVITPLVMSDDYIERMNKHIERFANCEDVEAEYAKTKGLDDEDVFGLASFCMQNSLFKAIEQMNVDGKSFYLIVQELLKQ